MVNKSKIWILKAKGEESSFGGNLGYPDKIDSHYVYDNNVKNFNKLKDGDFIILANKKHILGYATVTSISLKRNVPKIRYRCPVCDIAEHSERKNIKPKYKCRNKHEFDKPKEQHIIVDEYTAHYDSTFNSVPAKTPVSLLSNYYLKRNFYYSIQEANQTLINSKLFKFIDNKTEFEITEPLELFDFSTYPDYDPSNEDNRELKFSKKPTRVGQERFKKELIKAYGSFCMLSESNIAATIEASHICNYRGEKDNNIRNGLLLRVDLHRLFDRDFLGINPQTLKIQIHPSLKNTYYEQYNGKQLKLKVKGRLPSFSALEKRWHQFQEKLK